MRKQSSAGNNNVEVDHHAARRLDEIQVQQRVDVVSLQEFSRLLASRPRIWHSASWERRQIQKVPPQLRLSKEQREHVYHPMMVSLGPYHHGKPELRRAEEFKYLCLDWCAGTDEQSKSFYYNKILEIIVDIRECYAEVTIVEKYDDKALALMMLLDACFIINFMHNYLEMNEANYFEWRNWLGDACIPFIFRDIIVLENQIPYRVLKLLISLMYEKQDAEGFVQRFLSPMLGIDPSQAEIPVEGGEPPIHFLEAFWREMTKTHPTLISIQQPAAKSSRPGVSMKAVHNELASKLCWPKALMREVSNQVVSKFQWRRLSNMREENNDHRTDISYKARRSVMELKAKGIHFLPSSSSSFMNITFTSHAVYGQLKLPIRPVSDLSLVIFSNMIAYEVSPNSGVDLAVLSYVAFMKSLIQSPEDVKELQERGILLNRFANREKVVKLFKEIDTFGLEDRGIFLDVEKKIEEHCNSRARTWMADLIHTRFRSPWTAIALFGAVFILCLTFLQTVFAIHPLK